MTNIHIRLLSATFGGTPEKDDRCMVAELFSPVLPIDNSGGGARVWVRSFTGPDREFYIKGVVRYIFTGSSLSGVDLMVEETWRSREQRDAEDACSGSPSSNDSRN